MILQLYDTFNKLISGQRILSTSVQVPICYHFVKMAVQNIFMGHNIVVYSYIQLI